MDQHEKAIKLNEEYGKKDIDLNEADTRNRIIDTVIYEILSWPKNSVGEEHHNKEGYTDYILYDSSKNGIVIIEAKKQGASFETPIINGKKKFAYVKLSTLMTSPSINNAIDQVRTYCIETCTMFGWITNGEIWILFKAYTKNWTEQNAFVIKDLSFFSFDFTYSYNNFSYDAIINRNSMAILLNPRTEQYRLTYGIKDKISSSNVPVDINAFAQYITRPVKYYFSDFPQDDKEFLEKCYVDEQQYRNTKTTLQGLFTDTASPYLKNSGVIDYERGKLASKLSKKISNFISYKENKHIVVIFGDRGCGKSTFIKKLVKYDIESFVLDKLEIVYIDLLSYAAIDEGKKEIKEKIWNAVIEKIDVDSILDDYQKFQTVLFPDEFGKYLEQLNQLYGPNIDVSIKGQKIEEKINQIKKDKEKIATALSEYLRNEKKSEIVVILDNTDQYTAEIQDFSFQVISEIFRVIKSLSIITMREERFYRSKNVGVLDAYETTQYHIASPHPDKVFIERLKYIIEALQEDEFYSELIENKEIIEFIKDVLTKENLQKFFRVFLNDFFRKDNLYHFLVSCAQKDMRKALELFRHLVISGYLNIHEMLRHSTYNLQVHQVLKPIMTPNKYYYEEKESSVPNLYKLRNPDHGSHFTSLRILKRLIQKTEEYYSLSILRDEFNSIYRMDEDFTASITELLHFRLIEANIKVDEFTPSIEQIQITPFGVYMLENLAHFFTYLDLVCVDCYVYKESVANYIATSASDEYRLFHKKERGRRLIERVKKTDAFIQYLMDEEKREIDLYGSNVFGGIAIEIATKYEEDLQRVKKSSLKQSYTSNNENIEVSTFFNSRKDITTS